MPDLAKKISSVLPKERVLLMKRIGALAGTLGFRAFAVGGLVRDLILGAANMDLDIVVEGDAIVMGDALAEETLGTIVSHKRFGTCTVSAKDGLKIDLATARSETYEKPGALPVVRSGSIEDDLARRDFTMNAMAISVNRPDFGGLLDLHNGRRDLACGTIRAMHDGSFIDDPTRILRAVRFGSRLRFAIDRHTESLIKQAVRSSAFESVSRERVREELMLMFQDKAPFEAVRRMARYGGFKFIHPAIKIDRRLIRSCGAIDAACAMYERLPGVNKPPRKWLMYMMALSGGLTYRQVSAICIKFAFGGADSAALALYNRKSGTVTRSLGSGRYIAPSEIYKLLRPLPLEVILTIMAEAPRVRARIGAFLTEYERTNLHIGGNDLKAMGLKNGPAFKEILDKVLCRKMDGKLRSKADELEYACVLAGNAAG
ncbi:MAG: hypothetical protein V1682_00315 [Candidatus Omnitrophota bacterium]